MPDDDLLHALQNRQLFVQVFVVAVLLSLSANAATNLVDRGGFWANVTALLIPLAGAAWIFFRYSRRVWPATTHAPVEVTYNTPAKDVIRPDGSEIAPWLPATRLERELHTSWLVWKGWPENPALPDASNPLASDVVPQGIIDCLEYQVLRRWSTDYQAGWSYGMEFEAQGRRRSSVDRAGKLVSTDEVRKLFHDNVIVQRRGISIPDKANIQMQAPSFRVPEGTKFTRTRNGLSTTLTLETPFQKVLVEIAHAGGRMPRPERITLDFDVIVYVIQRPVKTLVWPDADDHIRWSARIARRTRDAFAAEVEPMEAGLSPAAVEQIRAIVAERNQTTSPQTP